MSVSAIPSPAPLLELRSAARTFGAGHSAVHALSNIDLTVQEGTSLAIMGRSGSGKSTLLNVIGLLDSLSSGQYLIRGDDVGRFRAGQRNSVRGATFGFVFQAFHLVPYLTVAENVEMGLTYQRQSRARREGQVSDLLERVGLVHRRSMQVATLSGGEKQRVAVARALLRNPPVLLADEPTGNLDDDSAAAVLDLFDEIVASGVALIIVTHDATTAARADRTIRMRDGRVQP